MAADHEGAEKMKSSMLKSESLQERRMRWYKNMTVTTRLN